MPPLVVLLLLAPLPHRLATSSAIREPSAEAIDQAVERGAAWLQAHQQRDGSWSYEAVRYPTGQTAFAAYTLLQSGVPLEHPSVRRALAFVLAGFPAETYGLGVELILLEATRDPAHLERMKELTDALIEIGLDGEWGYPLTHGPEWVPRVGRPDLSNTQYAVLGLRAAHHAGVSVPRKLWDRIFERALDYQESPHAVDRAAFGLERRPGKELEAGFRYLTDGSRAPSGSMTAAGMTVLGIVREVLGKRLGSRREKQVQEAREQGMRWLDLRWSVESNPGEAGWQKYYLYGLERVGALYATETIGQHAWFAEGAEQLLQTQAGNGSWGDQPADTCFAILFLKRATAAAVSERGGPGAADVWSSPQGDVVRLHVRGQPNATVWVEVPRGAARKSLEAELGGDLAVERVEYLVDGEVVSTQDGDASAPRETERFADRLAFTTRGTRTVAARVHLAPSPALGPLEPLETSSVEVPVPYALEDWMLDFAAARGRNLLSGAGFEVSASSQISADEGAAKAFDGRQGSRWLAAREDRLPWLRLELERSVKARRLVLSQATPREFYRGYLTRIAAAELYLNRSKEPIEVRFEADEMRPTVVELPRGVAIRDLELRVTERAEGSAWPELIGLAEVALE